MMRSATELQVPWLLRLCYQRYGIAYLPQPSALPSPSFPSPSRRSSSAIIDDDSDGSQITVLPVGCHRASVLVPTPLEVVEVRVVEGSS